MIARSLCLAAILSTRASSTEIVVLHNGVRIEVDRAEREGNDVWLYTANGIQHYGSSAVLRIETVPPPGQASTPPAAAAQPRPQFSDRARRLVEEAAVKHKLDPDFVHAVAQAESNYHQRAISHAGAIGIMQLMPATAAELRANPYNAAENVDAGVRLLRELLLKYDRHPNGVALALAAYNAGEGAVQRHHGVPPYRETKHYVRKVIRRYNALAGDTP
jgi:soluble lytic murein transglycosylase-like protein